MATMQTDTQPGAVAAPDGRTEPPAVRIPKAPAQWTRVCSVDDIPPLGARVIRQPDAPNIAGQTEAYLATQLRAFKSGNRKSEAMTLVASTLTDQDIDNLAAYFAAIEIKVVKIPGG